MWLEFYIPLENCSHTWRHHHYWLLASNFYLSSALIANEQWGFLSVPTCYDSEAVTTCFLRPMSVAAGMEHPIFSMQREGSKRLRHSKRKLIGEWYFYVNRYTQAAYTWKIAFMYHEQYKLYLVFTKNENNFNNHEIKRKGWGSTVLIYIYL